MNSSRIGFLTVSILLPALGVFFITNALTSGGNVIANSAILLMIVGFLIGLIKPKAAMYFTILATGYLDLIKRLMILDSTVRFEDLYYILGIPPCIMSGMILHYLLIHLKNHRESKEDLMRFIICSMLAAVMGATQLRAGMSALGNAANAAVYLYMLYIMPCLIKEGLNIRKFLTFIFFVFIPVALYGVYQSKFGLMKFEMDYLLSGLSLEIRQLNERIFRPFSTMNAAGNLSTVASSFCALCLIMSLSISKKISSRIGFLIAAVIFGYGAYITFSRGGWICGVSIILFYLAFRYKLTTIGLYLTAITAFVLLFAYSGTLVKNDKMAELSHMLSGEEGGDERSMATRLGTFTSRLISLDLTRTTPARWRPFGVIIEGVSTEQFSGSRYNDRRYYVHDGFSHILLSVGYIPMFIVFIFASYFLIKSHTSIWKIRDKDNRLFCLMLFSASAGIFVGFFANSAQIQTYPVNFYLYFFLGAALAYMKVYRPDFTNRSSLA
ncbi:MAG: hypothetical protein QM627_06545 [Luteolibacter sp.]